MTLRCKLLGRWRSRPRFRSLQLSALFGSVVVRQLNERHDVEEQRRGAENLIPY
jgi:hypothetical protein